MGTKGSRSRELDEVISEIPRLIVPKFADGCVLYLKDASGLLRVMAHAHDDPEKSELLYEWACAYRRSISDSGGVGAVVRTGEPLFVELLSKDVLTELAPDERYIRLIEALALRSLIIVPLDLAEQQLGALVLVTSEPRSYDAGDFSIATKLAQRISAALGDAPVVAVRPADNELVIDYDELVITPDGERYRARARGQKTEDGRWVGWLEFVSVETGEPRRTERETTQSTDADLRYWANGITAIYLEGALARASLPRDEHATF